MNVIPNVNSFRIFWKKNPGVTHVTSHYIDTVTLFGAILEKSIDFDLILKGKYSIIVPIIFFNN